MLNSQDTIIICCSSLEGPLRKAQENAGTCLPVAYVDQALHVEPGDMRLRLLGMLAELDPCYTTVLVAMGFCGGAWDQVVAPRRLVIPRTDDCVSLLLHTDDEYKPNRKEFGHLYLYEEDPAEFGADYFARSSASETENIAPGMPPETLREMLYSGYHHLDIIDTGVNDCYSLEYASAAQQVADRLCMDLDYVQGSVYMLEKLVRGLWDQQFIVAEPGDLVRHGSFF